MLKNFQGDSWGSIPPLHMPSLLPHDLCHRRSSSHWFPASADNRLYSKSFDFNVNHLLKNKKQKTFIAHLDWGLTKAWLQEPNQIGIVKLTITEVLNCVGNVYFLNQVVEIQVFIKLFTFLCCDDLEFSVEKKLNEYSFLCWGFCRSDWWIGYKLDRMTSGPFKCSRVIWVPG